MDAVERVADVVARTEKVTGHSAMVAMSDLRALLALARSNRDAEHDAFIRGYLACLSDEASPYKEDIAKQMAEDAWLDRLTVSDGEG